MAKSNIYFYLYISICILQGGFSTSTPDNIGYIEVFIGFLLVLLFNPVVIAISFRDVYARICAWDPMFLGLIVALFYFFIFISFHGLVVNENELSDFIRDFIPLIFLLIPMLGYSHLSIYDRASLNSQRLAWGLFFLGLGYLVQYIMSEDFNIYDVGARLMIGDSTDNILQDPSVSFLASFSCLNSIYLFRRKKIFKAIFFGLISLSVLSAFIAAVLRAPLGLFVLVLFLFYFFDSENSITSKVALIGILIFSILIAFDFGLFDIVISKSIEVGTNGRSSELDVVLKSIDSVEKFSIGSGWGGVIEDPFNHGYVRYTHNYLTYIFIKAGVFGLIIVFPAWAYIFIVILKLSIEASDFKRILALSMLSPFLISTLLEPMYKSMSFGILMFILISINFSLKEN